MTHEDILDSEHGSNLLAFLLLAPARSYTAKELGARLDYNDRILNPILQEFLDDSIVRQLVRGDAVLYSVNQRHKLLPEVKASLLRNQPAYEDELFSLITKLGDVKAAFLSGIMTGQETLPVDLLLVGKISLSKLDEFLKQIKSTMGLDLNYSIMTEDEFKLRSDTFDRFIKDIFDYPHVVVVDKLRKTKKK